MSKREKNTHTEIKQNLLHQLLLRRCFVCFFLSLTFCIRQRKKRIVRQIKKTKQQTNTQNVLSLSKDNKRNGKRKRKAVGSWPFVELYTSKCQ